MRRFTQSRGRLLATAPVPASAFREFEQLADRELNFEPLSFDDAALDPHWRLDRRRLSLPAEPPGPPRKDGPYAVAREVLVGYRFADPSVVRAVYDPASDLDGRNLLLVGRFFGLRFHMGVRIGGVAQEKLEHDPPIHRFRWHYQTLEGHLERGRMVFELCKWTDTGAIEFRIRAYSRRAQIDNPIVRLGFILFGRLVQLRFYDLSLARMRALVVSGSSPHPAR